MTNNFEATVATEDIRKFALTKEQYQSWEQFVTDNEKRERPDIARCLGIICKTLKITTKTFRFERTLLVFFALMDGLKLFLYHKTLNAPHLT